MLFRSVTNTSTSTINGWSLAFAFPSGQTITNSWSGQFTQSGANVTVTGLSWNANLAPGASVEVGFNADHSGTNGAPVAFALNGTSCTTS